MIAVTVGTDRGDFVGAGNAALQQAIEAVAAQGGGTVELLPGCYTLHNSVLLRSNVRLIGAGPDTVLRKADGVASPLAIDADYGQTKATVQDASGFRAGQGVVVQDDRAGGWIATLATITSVQGNTLYMDRRFAMDYDSDRGGMVFTSFPLVAGFDLEGASVEGLLAEGNRANSLNINGCIGGGYYLHRARRCRIADCVLRDFAGDGISFQITQDIVVERCDVSGVSSQGLHPGTGSARPIVRDCSFHHNDHDGFFLCWRVQEGRFENNSFCDNGHFGICIGHKDTDNLFVGNVVRNNALHGICFRDEKPTNGGHRNTFRRNTIEDNGDCGVYVGGHTQDLCFEDNVIRDTRSGPARTQRIGLCVGEGATGIRAARNVIENHLEADVKGHFGD